LRTKLTKQGYLEFGYESSLKVVRQYRKKYEAIGKLLEVNPGLLDLAHQDFSKLSQSKKGRESGYTSEQILRAVVVLFLEGAAYRDMVILVENSDFLRSFVKLGMKPMMDYSFVCKAFGVLSAKTWKAMNERLSRYAKAENKISGEDVRVDTTAYESTIHYPTDSSLLWDSYRTLSRLMKSERRELLAAGLNHRFHTKKVKKLAFFISRNAKSPSKSKKRKVKSTYRILIERVRWISEIGEQAAKSLAGSGSMTAWAVTEELNHYLPIIRKIISQAERRVIKGEQVPGVEKIYSLFEDHVEMIKRGKAAKPMEFGHKVLFVESREKFIFHYEAYRQQRADQELLKPTLAAHRKLFRTAPDLLATDKGFYEGPEQLKKLAKKIATVSICKKGRRTAEEKQRESSEAFKAGQRFRAGCEGTISVLKRAFKLGRCLFKGFRNYASSVGCSVFCHNLVLLASL
jgi:IS5 family transposase